jgi:NAD(P)-dependent dehydrogenase (short-subunit alcohol dehydrogenase family)
MQFSNKVVVVTGGAAGIGKATCLAFHRENAAVVIIDIDIERGQSVLDEILQDGGNAIFIRADISQEKEVDRIPSQVIGVFGGIDVLVNNAGIPHSGTVIEDSPDTWDKVFNVNLRGAYLCSHFILPELLTRPKANIVNVGSVQSCVASPRSAAYVASKFGLLGLTKAMAVDHSPHVRVNAVLPGSIDTAMFRSELSSKIDLETKLREVASKQLIGRIGYAEEVAKAIVFLAGEDASFITGVGLVVDGGLTAKI